MTLTLSPRSVRRGGALFAQTPALSPALTGIAAGVFAALIWATYLVFAKSGTGVGLMPQDFVLLRFGSAAAIMLPWLLRNDPRTLAGIGWRRAIILTVLAGPPFILLGTGGYVFAPLAHGAVIQPSTITLASMFAAAYLLKERLTADKLIGVGLIITGLAVIAFGVAVRHLGAAKAGLFPAIVPAATLIVGTVLTGAMPTVFEWTGAALATLGLVTAIGLVRPIFTPTRTLILAKG